MSDRTFVDTNVLVYAFDDSEPEKRDVARETLADERHGELVLSAQVLSELYVAITCKLDPPVPGARAAEAVEQLSLGSPIVSLDASLVRRAVGMSRSAQLSYWDGLIVAAATKARCSTLLTEDLNDGQQIGTVRVENPFRDRQ